MNDSTILTTALLGKIEEQIDLADRLITLAPANRLDWQPLPGTFRFDELLGHLLDVCAGICAALYALRPDELSHFGALRQLPVNHRCGIEEGRTRLRSYLAHIREGFVMLSDADLKRPVPTVFAAAGETALTILLGNLEHLINHKYQLFFYLKLVGIDVGTPDLYKVRGAPTG